MKTKRLLLAVIVFLSAFVAAADEMTEAELLRAIQERPARAAGGYCTYEAPLKVEDTPAPSGFKPFYVSHLGRHGSRYHGSVSGYEKPLKVFKAMKERKCLTATGDSLYADLRKMAKCQKDNDGLLTSVGEAEHFGIGKRLASRVPAVFRDKKRNVVYCSSTTSQRCIQSMASFAMGVKDAAPAVSVDFNVGLANDFANFRSTPVIDKKLKNDLLKRPSAEAAGKQMALLSLDALADRLFTDRKELEREAGNAKRFLYSVYSVSADQFCLGTDAKPFSYFTYEELLECWKVYNVHHANYGVFEPVNDIRRQDASRFALQLVKEADEAIRGNGRCADLRFAHDGNIGPFLALMAIEGWDKTVKDEIYLHWQSWRYLSMGTNVQFIFYQNRGGEVLVKILRNEKEALVPALRSVSGPYYRWSDLKPYILKRAGVDGPSQFETLKVKKGAD